VSKKSVHEPEAELMSAADTWDDAQMLAEMLQRNLLQTQPVVKLPVPFSLFLSTLDSLNREELMLLRQRVEERLAA
jgi:hypothetical protein